MSKAIDIIRSEHRNLASILFSLNGILDEVEKGATDLEIDLFHALIDYLKSFLYTYHHPKENEYLFALLRKRYPQSAAQLDRLEQQHREGDKHIKALETALAGVEQEGRGKLRAFRKAVDDYHQFEWSHMEEEEKEILPLAQQYLTAEDWRRIDQAFTDHSDPVFGDVPTDRFKKLMTQITRMAKAPYGYRDD